MPVFRIFCATLIPGIHNLALVLQSILQQLCDTCTYQRVPAYIYTLYYGIQYRVATYSVIPPANTFNGHHEKPTRCSSVPFLVIYFSSSPLSLDTTDELDQYRGTGTRPRRLGRSRCLLRLVHVVSGHRSRTGEKQADHRLLTFHSLRARFFFHSIGTATTFFFCSRRFFVI